MADIESPPSFGAELKNGFKTVNAWVSIGNGWLDEIQQFYRDRSAIEKEYAQKLASLAKKYYEKKLKKSSSLSVGDNPTITPGSLECASMTTWAFQLTTLEKTASEHEHYAKDLLSKVAEPLKVLNTELEQLRKVHGNVDTELEREWDVSHQELKKVKSKYDNVCQEVENKRKKQDATFEFERTKATAAFQQHQEDMRNAKNTYILTINMTNKQQERHYNKYLATLLDSLQDVSEIRVSALNSLWLTAASLEQNVLTNGNQALSQLCSEIPRNDPHLDSSLFMRHNATNWHAPGNFIFSPSPVWHDDSSMAVDATSQVFLRNILRKSKPALSAMRQEVDKKQRDVDKVRNVRLQCRQENNFTEEIKAIDAGLALQNILHESERKMISLEVEISTITSAIGDISIGATAHKFKTQTFKIPTNCDLCGERIWGLSAKCLVCSDCGFTCHSKCEMKVVPDCPGEVDKATLKLLKQSRQASAAAAHAESATQQRAAESTQQYDQSRQNGQNGHHDDIPESTRLGRRDTIGSMSTLSSGYAASTRRSVSGNVDDQSVTSTPKLSSNFLSTITGKNDRRAAFQPNTSTSSIALTEPTGGKMQYAYDKNGDDEVSVAEGENIIVIEADDGSGWTRIQKVSNSDAGLVPTSYIDFTPVIPRSSPVPSSVLPVMRSNRRSLAAPPDLGPRPSSSSISPSRNSIDQSSQVKKKVGPTVAPRRAKASPAVPSSSVTIQNDGQTDDHYVQALYTYTATSAGETDMTEGEKIKVVNPDNGDGWIEVERTNGQRGVVPSGWVKYL